MNVPIGPPTNVPLEPPRTRKLSTNPVYHHLHIADDADIHLLDHAATPQMPRIAPGIAYDVVLFEETHSMLGDRVDISQVAIGLDQEADEGQETRHITVELVQWMNSAHKTMDW